MKKRQYLAANIRAGYTAQEASERAINSCYMPPFNVEIDTYNHGRDGCGNGTAHYVCYLRDSNDREILRIVESGKRREQVGYSGQNEAALYALEKLGFEIDKNSITWERQRDWEKSATYPLLNFPVEKGINHVDD